MGIELPADFQARQINPERDIVEFDVVLVMDKFTAADVLREVRTARRHFLSAAVKKPGGCCAVVMQVCSSQYQAVCIKAFHGQVYMCGSTKMYGLSRHVNVATSHTDPDGKPLAAGECV